MVDLESTGPPVVRGGESELYPRFRVDQELEYSRVDVLEVPQTSMITTDHRVQGCSQSPLS
jgi:hypothetical protein